MAGSQSKERDVFIDNYSKLTSTVMDIDSLLPHFVTAKIINVEDMAVIQAPVRNSEKVQKLLNFIAGIKNFITCNLNY